ncbi:MAG: type II CAAX endopeptidase family protein [Bryobacteraceae bacterium]
MILAFPLLWALGAVAGYLYAKDRGIPMETVLAVLPAFLLEVSFFYTLGVEGLRTKLERRKPWVLALLLITAAVAPYMVAALLLHAFSWQAVGLLAALSGIAAFWYVLLPERPSVDILFLVFIAVIYLLKLFAKIYPAAHPRVPMAILGQLMWFRTGLFAMVSIHRTRDIGFGFWPTAREWGIGLLYFVLLIPVVGVLAWSIDFTQPHIRYAEFTKFTLVAIGTFFGILWVVALGEEFFFRGLLQQWITTWTGKPWLGLVFASMLFGSVHFWYGQFPNWRFASLAAVAGLFYGMAFRKAKSIRASMVTHALTVTTWRLFFS